MYCEKGEKWGGVGRRRANGIEFVYSLENAQFSANFD